MGKIVAFDPNRLKKRRFFRGNFCGDIEISQELIDDDCLSRALLIELERQYVDKMCDDLEREILGEDDNDEGS